MQPFATGAHPEASPSETLAELQNVAVMVWDGFRQKAVERAKG